MRRKDAARIVHDFLRTEMKEADEIDVTPAYVLRDLFDCRVCAGHIMQVYVKGIMDEVLLPDGRIIFDAEKLVSEAELSDILTRVCYPDFRKPRVFEPGKKRQMEEPVKIPFAQVKQVFLENKKVLLVDVRTEREYEQEHLENATNIPILSIIKNPFVFSENRDKLILLYCEEGVQSQAAARCLKEAGYEKVAYFAWKESVFSFTK